MFKFIQARREAKAGDIKRLVIAECAAELQRSGAALWRFVTVPRDIATREAILQKAVKADCGGDETVLRLAFLHHLLSVLPLAAQTSAEEKDALLAEARRLSVDGDAVRSLQAMRALELLAQDGPRMVERDLQGRAVFLRCLADFKNRPGTLEVREDGLFFLGEVVLDLPWQDVMHVSATTHTYQGVEYVAVACQEQKRRTATKLAFPCDHEDALKAATIVAVWQQNRERE